MSDALDVALDPKTATKLASLSVSTVGELLRYAPRRYVRHGQLSNDELPENDEWVTIVGRITGSRMIQMRKRHGQFLKVAVTDGNHAYEANFFNARFIAHQLKSGARVMMAGKVKTFQGKVQLSHPEWAVLPDGDPEVDRVVGSAMLSEMYAVEAEITGGEVDPATFDRPIVPIYPATKEIQTWDIWGAIRRILAAMEDGGDVEDALTPEQRAGRELIGTDDALRRIHLPDTEDDIDAARARLKFDEALAIQTVLAQRRIAGRAESAPPCPHVVGGLEDRLLERLPFTLTEGQRTVVAEIADELGHEVPMSRLLQGEVGSGKTLVSLLAMLRVVDNGHQCAILAPTEVLAAQHHRTIRTMLGDLAEAGQLTAAEGATTIALLTGSMKTAGKRQTLLDVVTGTAGIVIGTHALLEENVTFFDLGMVVVDEQHRFGVEQRDVLRAKGKDGLMPHFLVMTATPIPRTVAMTVFGDLETSTLTELPRGRQPISTSVVPMGNEAWVDRAWARAAEEIAAGRQVYVVCSRIGDDPDDKKSRRSGDDEGQAPKSTSVVDQYAELLAGPLGSHRIEMLHGRLPADEKNAVMDAFGRGEIDLVVSTTVIEVGVDVPNATMMVIVDAERFGVSQLHQLRGRVGRGGHAGLCLLMTSAPQVSQAMQRLRAVEASTDGFDLARVDLEQRREGDVLGSLQSGGTSSLRFLSLLADSEVIADARDLADEIVGKDLPLADHRPLADLVDAILVPNKVKYLDKS
ncbi:ATP-dependent DNA helicase RecG [Gordonia sp. SID5947]|uniref:ATP-dependent DNA helicase RecG n=1 Tax=Gordonia sp. SID5947 TaxID=2690315 RepID=UPI00136F866A|nr:ATP-dependent DNA helicase RecG [Gordonia sp. SID5947]MYR05057.1 ATP-dependent DNA helicase RecG [Gordonia sp. SID5947]